MEQKIKLVETRLKKDIEKPIYEIKGSEELIEATAAQVLSRKTDSAAFVYVNPQLRVVTMQISSIKTLERHKEEIIATTISHNVGAILITSNIKYEYGNLKAVEFLDNWQQAFFNAGVPVLEHLQTWIDENGDIQSYSFRNEGLIVDFDRLGVSQIPNNDIVISKSKFFSSQLELKEIGEFDIGEAGDLISLEKGIKDEDTLNQIYQEYMKQDNIPLLSKELDELVDKTAEIEKSQKVYLNVHNSFAKLNVESKYEQGKTYNVVRLPEGSVIGDKDYSGASFYPLDKYIYPNKFNENLTTVQFKSGQDIKLYFKDRKPETVEAEDICKAVDSANKKYLEQKTEKESGDKEKKSNDISKLKKRQKDLGEEL